MDLDTSILSVLRKAEEPMRGRDIADRAGCEYATVMNRLNGLRRLGLVERVKAAELVRTVTVDGKPVRLGVESNAVGWRISRTEQAAKALEAAWEAPAVEPERTVDPTPADLVGRLTRLTARLRTATELLTPSPTTAELARIAEGLVDVRDDLVALIVDGGPESECNIGGEISTADVAMPERSPTPDYGRNRRTREKNPEPGKRRCSKCRLLKPVTEFAFSDRTTGKRRADCRSCYNDGQRTRYVRAGYKIVTVEVMEGDYCVGHPCPVCEQPFEVGQLVQGENVMHADCREDP